MISTLKKNEVEELRNAPGAIADGGATTPKLWDLERRGYLRPILSYNPEHYRIPNASCHIFPHVGYAFDVPVYAYTRTEFGEDTNAFHIEQEGGESVDI